MRVSPREPCLTEFTVSTLKSAISKGNVGPMVTGGVLTERRYPSFVSAEELVHVLN